MAICLAWVPSGYDYPLRGLPDKLHWLFSGVVAAMALSLFMRARAKTNSFLLLSKSGMRTIRETPESRPDGPVILDNLNPQGANGAGSIGLF